MKEKSFSLRRSRSDRLKKSVGKRLASPSAERDRCVSPHLSSAGVLATSSKDSRRTSKINDDLDTERTSRRMAVPGGSNTLERSNTFAVSAARTGTLTRCPPPPFLTQDSEPRFFVFPPKRHHIDEATAASRLPQPVATQSTVKSLPSTVTSPSGASSSGDASSPTDSVFSHSPPKVVILKAVYARAIFDNEADNKRELSFQRGDTLTVLEQDVAGLTGWWLCTFRGQTGIVPGNRVKLIPQENVKLEPIPKPGSRSGTTTPTNKGMDWRAMWQARSRVVTPRRQGDVYVYDQRSSTGSQQSQNSDYDVPPAPVKVDTGQKNVITNRNGFPTSHSAHVLGAQPTYDTPRSSRASLEDLYDVPKSDHSESNRSSTFSVVSSLSSASNVSPSPASHESSLDNSMYDVPPSRRSRSLTSGSNHTNSFTSDLSDLYDIPAKISTASPLKKSLEKLVNKVEENGIEEDCSQEPDYVQIPDDVSPTVKSGISVEVNGRPASKEFSQTLYDIPPQVTKDTPLRKSSSQSSVDHLEARLKHLSTSSQDSRCSETLIVNFDPLPLELDAAMDKFSKLQQDVQSSISRLLGFVSSTWRQRQNLEVHIYSIKMACNSFHTSLKDFVNFSQGALANSTNASDKNLCHKLYKALVPLQTALRNMDDNMNNLESMKWDVSQLIVEPKQGVLSKKMDSLGAIVALAQDMLSDLRGVVSMVQANSSLIFRQKKDEVVKLPDGRIIDKHVSVPLPSPPKEEDVPSQDDKKDSSSDYENDGKEWTDGYDYVHMEKRKNRKQKVTNNNKEKLVNTVKLPPADKQLLLFYSAQIQNQSVMLNDSIDTFLACIEQNQPPKVFVANSKFVVLNAHKMVYIGDTLHRNLLQTDVRTNIMHGANILCDVLKKALAVTKTAALQYPAIVAIQDMVDRVVDVSNAAHQLKLVITTAANLDVINS